MPESAVSSPAMIRSIVVFPPPEGPSSATSSPDGTSKLTFLSAVKLPNALLTFPNLNGHGFVDGLFHLALGNRLDHQRHQRQKRQQRRHGERRLKVVLVVENLHLQRQRVRQAADVPDTTDTAPNSPIARALHRMTP